MIIKPWSAILCLLFSHIVFEYFFFLKVCCQQKELKQVVVMKVKA